MTEVRASLLESQDILQLCSAKNLTSEVVTKVKRELEPFREDIRPLERIVDLVVPQLIDRWILERGDGDSSVHVLQLMYSIAAVVGHKRLAISLPLDASHARLIYTHLQIKKPADWQGTYILLLWLGALVLLPFDLCALGLDDVSSEIEFFAGFLSCSGKEREAASLLLSRLISNHGSPETLDQFVTWSQARWEDAKIFEKLGILQTTAHIAASKTLPLGQLATIAFHGFDIENDTALRLSFKALSRIALSEPAYAETVLAHAFDCLGHNSTTVRFTCSKVIARLAAMFHRRPETSGMALELIDFLFDTFNGVTLEGLNDANSYLVFTDVSEERWHGALLCLAEIVKVRVCSDSARLTQVLLKSLHFVQRHFRHTSGSNVRDSACYLSWALFRYGRIADQNQLHDLYNSLLAVACYDREINVRRAAAAALQEGLGRQQGLDVARCFFLMENVNYDSVHSLSECYLTIAPRVLSPQAVAYLIQDGVLSFNAGQRRLAAKGLPLLCISDKWKEAAIDLLLDVYDNSDEDIQHGVHLALSSLCISTVYRRDDVRLVLLGNHNISSPIISESILCLASIFATDREVLPLITNYLAIEDDNVFRQVETLVPQLPEPIARKLVTDWAKKMGTCSTFVLALGCSPLGVNYLLDAATLPDAKSRALAVSKFPKTLLPACEELILDGLDDYSIDERGDVGSWVREAAIRKVSEFRGELSAGAHARAVSGLWRISGESLEKLRRTGYAALSELTGLTFDTDQSYFFHLLKHGVDQPELPKALVSTLGSQATNPSTLRDALGGAVLCLESQGTIGARFIKSVLGMGFFGKLGSTVLRAVQRLCDAGASQYFPEDRLVAMMVDLLRYKCKREKLCFVVDIAPHFFPTSAPVLIRLCGNSDGYVRSRAAEALFECGINTDTLVGTDWTGDNTATAFRELQRELQQELKSKLQEPGYALEN